jgi:hypothetical protein
MGRLRQHSNVDRKTITIKHIKRSKNKELVMNVETSDRYITEDSKGHKVVISKTGVDFIDTSLDGRTVKSTHWNFCDDSIETNIKTIDSTGAIVTTRRFINNKWVSTTTTNNGLMTQFMDFEGTSRWFEYPAPDERVEFVVSPDGEDITRFHYKNDDLLSVTTL